MARDRRHLALAITVLLAACGMGSLGDSGTQCPEGPPPQPYTDCSSSITGLTLSAATDHIEVGRGVYLSGSFTATPPGTAYCSYTTRLWSSDSTIAGPSGTVVGGGYPGQVIPLALAVGLAPGTVTFTHSAGTGAATLTVTVVPVSSPFTAISTGGFDVCTLGPDGKLYCLNGGTSGVPALVGGVTLASLDVGPSQDCGITSAKQVYCWGSLGAIWGTYPPLPVNLPLDAVAVEAGGTNHACALTTSHSAYCWGGNGSGQLGLPGNYNYNGPLAVAGGLKLQKITAGDTHTCGLGDDGSLWCWGSNSAGQLGVSSTAGGCPDATCQPSPIRVRLGTDSVFRDVAAGFNHTCALTAGGDAYCWGSGTSGALGTGDTLSGSTPRKVAGNRTFVALSAGERYTCGLTAAGAAFCWGTNSNGELGTATVNTACGGLSCETTPVAVSGGLTFTALSAGSGMTCGMTSSGAWCWGGASGANWAFGSVPTRVRGQP